ncbi:hypothetical protein DFH06DRAFT_1118558 [Mycena polygramma]|nr:hypothetical protein DFH06DRAFT_1118558 [Mycena polygramma]
MAWVEKGIELMAQQQEKTAQKTEEGIQQLMDAHSTNDLARNVGQRYKTSLVNEDLPSPSRIQDSTLIFWRRSLSAAASLHLSPESRELVKVRHGKFNRFFCVGLCSCEAQKTIQFIEQAWGLVSRSELGELDMLLDKLSRSVAMNSSDFMSNGLLAFPFSGIRVVFFTDRSGGDVEAANRGRIVSYDEEYMILSAPDVDKLDPAEPPTALAGCYYAGSTSRTPVSVLKPLNALRFGVFQKATAGFFLFRDLVPCLPYAGCAISNSLALCCCSVHLRQTPPELRHTAFAAQFLILELLGPKVLPAPDTSSEYFGPASNFLFGCDIQKSSGGLRFVQRNNDGCFLRRFLGYEILRSTIFDRDGRELAKFERENSDIPYFTSFPRSGANLRNRGGWSRRYHGPAAGWVAAPGGAALGALLQKFGSSRRAEARFLVKKAISSFHGITVTFSGAEPVLSRKTGFGARKSPFLTSGRTLASMASGVASGLPGTAQRVRSGITLTPWVLGTLLSRKISSANYTHMGLFCGSTGHLGHGICTVISIGMPVVAHNSQPEHHFLFKYRGRLTVCVCTSSDRTQFPGHT